MTEGAEPKDLSLLSFETPWVWYAHFHCASVNYGASYMELGRFSTIREFWCMYNNLPGIEHIHDGTVRLGGAVVVAYSLFRDGVRPEWEDKRNIVGSEWGCRENLDKEQFVTLWKEYLLGTIGEKIPHCLGIRAINKSNRTRVLHKIEVWMDCVDNAKTQMCRRSLSELVPWTPRFSHMLHQEKQTQALEYQKRRRRTQPHGGRGTLLEYEDV